MYRSRLTMQEHWRAGYHDAARTLRYPEVLQRPTNPEGLFTFDLHQDGRESKRRTFFSRSSRMSTVLRESANWSSTTFKTFD